MLATFLDRVTLSGFLREQLFPFVRGFRQRLDGQQTAFLHHDIAHEFVLGASPAIRIVMFFQ